MRGATFPGRAGTAYLAESGRRQEEEKRQYAADRLKEEKQTLLDNRFKYLEKTVAYLEDKFVQTNRMYEDLLYNLDFENMPLIEKHFKEVENGFSLLAEWQGEATAEMNGIRQTVSSQAGLITTASETAATAIIMAEMVVKKESGVYKVNAAEIVTAVNDSGSEIVLNADKINLNGVTAMKGLTNVADTLTLGIVGESNTGTLVFPNSAYIERQSGQMKVYSSNTLEIQSPTQITMTTGFNNYTDQIYLAGRSIMMSNFANRSGSGTVQEDVNVVGSLTGYQRVFIGIVDGKLRVSVQEGNNTNGFVYDFEPI